MLLRESATEARLALAQHEVRRTAQLLAAEKTARESAEIAMLARLDQSATNGSSPQSARLADLRRRASNTVGAAPAVGPIANMFPADLSALRWIAQNLVDGRVSATTLRKSSGSGCAAHGRAAEVLAILEVRGLIRRIESAGKQLRFEFEPNKLRGLLGMDPVAVEVAPARPILDRLTAALGTSELSINAAAVAAGCAWEQARIGLAELHETGRAERRTGTLGTRTTKFYRMVNVLV